MKHSPTVRIRKIRRSEKKEWLRMRYLLWSSDSKKIHAQETAEIFRYPQRNAVFVAELPDHRLVGFVETSIRDYAQGCHSTPVGYMEGWFVQFRFRGRGIGKKLVAVAEAWAKKKGCTEMASDTPIKNIKSFKAHRALGYIKEDVLIHFRKKLRTAD